MDINHNPHPLIEMSLPSWSRPGNFFRLGVVLFMLCFILSAGVITDYVATWNVSNKLGLLLLCTISLLIAVTIVFIGNLAVGHILAYFFFPTGVLCQKCGNSVSRPRLALENFDVEAYCTQCKTWFSWHRKRNGRLGWSNTWAGDGPVDSQASMWEKVLLLPFLLLLILLSPILIPLLLFVFLTSAAYNRIYGIFLHHQVAKQWFPAGKRMLLVYSDSPNWKEHIENSLLPIVRDYAVVLNWSKRSSWDIKRKPLEVKVFQHWTDVSVFKSEGRRRWEGENFNPIAIVFMPGGKVEVLRFWKAFKDHKHGKSESLEKLEKKLGELIATIEKH